MDPPGDEVRRGLTASACLAPGRRPGREVGAMAAWDASPPPAPTPGPVCASLPALLHPGAARPGGASVTCPSHPPEPPGWLGGWWWWRPAGTRREAGAPRRTEAGGGAAASGTGFWGLNGHRSPARRAGGRSRPFSRGTRAGVPCRADLAARGRPSGAGRPSLASCQPAGIRNARPPPPRLIPSLSSARKKKKKKTTYPVSEGQSMPFWPRVPSSWD